MKLQSMYIKMAPLVGVRKACAVGKTVSQSYHARLASKVGCPPSIEGGSVVTGVERNKTVRFATRWRTYAFWIQFCLCITRKLLNNGFKQAKGVTDYSTEKNMHFRITGPACSLREVVMIITTTIIILIVITIIKNNSYSNTKVDETVVTNKYQKGTFIH